MVNHHSQFDKLAVADKLEDALGLTVKVGEPMNLHTSFRVGGPADIYLEPTTVAELQGALALISAEGVPYRVIGNGTNLLVADEGYRGAIVRLGPRFAKWSRESTNQIWAEAGIPLPVLAKRAANEGLSGLEFVSGIPGTLGGAIHMNAGAWGSTIGEKVSRIWVLGDQGVEKLEKEMLSFGYRQSNLGDKVIVAAEFVLAEASSAEIQERMQEYLKRRQDTQPLGLPSAGSVFRNPEGYKSAKLIDEAGLKGLSIGGAQVSPIHANFIVNLGYATASDIYRLITEVQAIVERETGILLQPEIELIGFSTP
ncbi:MAG: UDP-N-acetylmuramate dehydrogenase [Firmicutes bacterium]|nr:UDP-N-acetylmuramate dehydrogenase [Bacillota bacterium]